MKWKNETKFHITGLNQEKLLNELSKKVDLSEIERNAKNDTTFKCSYFEHKKVLKVLKNKNVNLKAVEHEGVAFRVKQLLSCYGLIAAVVVISVLYFLQSGFVLQYEVSGVDRLSAEEIVAFVKTENPSMRTIIDTETVESSLMSEFDGISFVSCIVKGQTLVINIKEKLMPDEMYGEFKPIAAKKDAKITEINLISGTLNVKVGDVVQAGDELVSPYMIDTSGNLKKVEAKAEIKAEVYNEGSVDHYETFIEVNRTGRTAVLSEITLFGLEIYNFKEEFDFKMYDVEFEETSLVKNLFLPFKMKKTVVYELAENVVESKFDEVKEEYIEKARKKALENCENCDTIKDEFYTLRHLAGVTIVNYCIVTEEVISV
ncbi:MAG: sporulation protein YqfD [Clostridia bacterium]|nr:sporulation protein YqfD [Clostridia bacterium]